MTTKLMSAALLALVVAATASVAQARSQVRTNYQGYDAPWSFACIKDHGTSRCNDLN